MYRIPLLFISALLALWVSACTPVQPAIPSDETTQSDSMADMDHGSMEMSTEVPFDAMFIDSMIEHHQGAIDMAQQVLDHSEQAELRTLAEAIMLAQTGEIAGMQTWRSAWYPNLAPTSGMDMGMGDMTIREDASKSFEQRFIEAMISHHQGAIDMADMALQMGEHEEIRTLAAAIIASQNAEIEQMQSWLADWYGVSQ